MNTYQVLIQLYHLIKIDRNTDNICDNYKNACDDTLKALDNLKKYY